MFSNILKGSSKSLISGFALGAAILFTSFNASAATDTDNSLENFKYCEGGIEIDHETAHNLIKHHGAVVIDVRTPQEYAKGHLKDAFLINLTLEQLSKQNLAEHELLKLLKEKNTPVLVYCHAGKRATFFMKAMVRDGYTHVMNMGGIKDWKYETTFDEPSKSFAEAVNEVPHCCTN